MAFAALGTYHDRPLSEPLPEEPQQLGWREILLGRLLVAVTPLIVAGVVIALLTSHGHTRSLFAFLLFPLALQILAALRPHWPFKLRAALLIAPLAFATYLTYFLMGFKGNASVIAACTV